VIPGSSGITVQNAARMSGCEMEVCDQQKTPFWLQGLLGEGLASQSALEPLPGFENSQTAHQARKEERQGSRLRHGRSRVIHRDTIQQEEGRNRHVADGEEREHFAAAGGCESLSLLHPAGKSMAGEIKGGCIQGLSSQADRPVLLGGAVEAALLRGGPIEADAILVAGGETVDGL